MAENIAAKDLKKGFGFTKKDRRSRSVFVIVSAHKDGTVSYAPDGVVKAYTYPVRISAEEFLKNVFGGKAETGAEKAARARAEDVVTAKRIERTKESQSKAVLMDLLLDAKAGKDIDALTEKLEDLMKSEREEAYEAGYEENGYESRRKECSFSCC